ncbi:MULTISPECIES: type II toxin-antitoxin system VapC family toxin [unclassified Anabaena]|uniref:type II toxin-antitoxin system VapC family toxin n=1 Tax=unclassified Anabaena TaxID=2619674 RepID=UPI0014461020|nr:MULTISPECIES: type II toxin-antitoxin system VapC family toxin [unclassified Anabaena]MTJ08674.1 type II toxin-antitoxin system VapC family toxin [Anabaena sp. UHCC 0204]MTJ52303.1 type II toxin-antitoxin system VapC family toxin [Anabaena sp. UHCC 0253]
MYLLDTNHCSRAILGDENVLHHLAEVENSLVATCVIVQGELVDMAKRSQHTEANLDLVHRFLNGIYIYNIDEITANLYGELKASLFNQFAPKEKSKRRKTKITNLGFDENDIWIAAVALQHNLTIVSSDSDFQRIIQVRAFSVKSWL